MRKSLLAAAARPAFLIIGAVIGAGFASGREIRSFFAVYGAAALWVIPLVFLLLYFGFSAMFATGRIFAPDSFSDISRRIFGRGALFFDVVMALSNLVFIAAMLAGFDSLGQTLFGFGKNNFLLSLAALILCSLLVMRGVKGLNKMNNILVPVMVVFLAAVCLFSIHTENLPSIAPAQTENFGKLIFNSVLFVFSNLFSCAGVLYTSGKNADKKLLNTGSVIGAAVLSAIMLLFILACLTASPIIFSADMPVIYLSQILGGFYKHLVLPVLVFSIFTTLLANMLNLFEFLSAKSENKYLIVAGIATFSFALRMLGFNIIVDYLYVYIGVFAAVYSAGNMVYLAVYRKKYKNKITVHI